MNTTIIKQTAIQFEKIINDLNVYSCVYNPEGTNTGVKKANETGIAIHDNIYALKALFNRFKYEIEENRVEDSFDEYIEFVLRNWQQVNDKITDFDNSNDHLQPKEQYPQIRSIYTLDELRIISTVVTANKPYHIIKPNQLAIILEMWYRYFNEQIETIIKNIN